jgi:hypothetical protein
VHSTMTDDGSAVGQNGAETKLYRNERASRVCACACSELQPIPMPSEPRCAGWVRNRPARSGRFTPARGIGHTMPALKC